MKIHFIKIALWDVSPMVWRRLRIPGTISLAQLHHIIQIANDWDDEDLHQFHIYGKDYGIFYLDGIAFVDNAYKIFLDDFDFSVRDKFTYEYNFFEHWVIDIRVEDIKETSSPYSVYCIKGNGVPGVSKQDGVEPTLNLLKAIAHADERTTVREKQ